MKNKDEMMQQVNSLPRLGVENDEIIADKIVNNPVNSTDEQSGIELSDSDLQLQVKQANIIRFMLE